MDRNFYRDPIFSDIDVIRRSETRQDDGLEYSATSHGQGRRSCWAGGSTTRQRTVIDPPRWHRGGRKKSGECY